MEIRRQAQGREIRFRRRASDVGLAFADDCSRHRFHRGGGRRRRFFCDGANFWPTESPWKFALAASHDVELMST